MRGAEPKARKTVCYLFPGNTPALPVSASAEKLLDGLILIGAVRFQILTKYRSGLLLRPFRNWLSGAQLIEQSLGLLEIVEPLREPLVDRSELFAGLLYLALVAPEPRHAHRSAQFPGCEGRPSSLPKFLLNLYRDLIQPSLGSVRPLLVAPDVCLDCGSYWIMPPSAHLAE
jgi:hypothetical protein